MINIAAHTKDGVKIPGRKQMRQAIIETFKSQLIKLHNQLNVSISISEYLSYMTKHLLE